MMLLADNFLCNDTMTFHFYLAKALRRDHTSYYIRRCCEIARHTHADENHVGSVGKSLHFPFI